MRIPFPERIPLDRAAIFVAGLFIIQSLEGTALYFSAGCAAFLLLATLAFNTAGGLSRASGAYIFFYSTLVVVIGVCYKAFLGEPANSNLVDPHTTIAVYVAGMAAMFAAVLVSRRLSRRVGLLQNVLPESQMYRACVGCIVFGIGGSALLALLGTGGARLETAFSQLNQLIPLGIIIGVMYEIRRSGGKRSINLPVAFAASFYFLFYGLLNFSKQGMLLPIFCWAVPACASRFRLSAMQVISGLVGAFIIFHYLVPYAQYGRNFQSQTPTVGDRIAFSAQLLEHPEVTRHLYEEDQSDVPPQYHYYNTQQGLWDRLQFVSVDDSLINITDQGKVFGLLPIKAEFLNAIPRVFWPNKPSFLFGNEYAHELGELPPDDTTTGISFSPTAEAFHLDRWVGLLVVAPLIWLLLFIVLDSILGDLRATPWGLLAVALLSHYAPEAGITGAIYALTYGTAILIFSAFFAAWVAPVFAIVVLGREHRETEHRISFRPTLSPRFVGRLPRTGSPSQAIIAAGPSSHSGDLPSMKSSE